MAMTPCCRDLCSRMNTFMLETERAAAREDKASLVVVSRTKERTVVRHLLSADSRVERVTWCDVLNRALNTAVTASALEPAGLSTVTSEE